MAIWPAQPSLTRARIGTGTIGTSTMRPDADRACAVPALRAELAAQHGHEAIYFVSCRHEARQRARRVVCAVPARGPAPLLHLIQEQISQGCQ
jgi:hypothetical protein